MRTISVNDLEQSPELYRELADVLHHGGLVCFPTGRQYGVAASLMSEDAVIRLVQTKRRAKRAPSLVFIPDRDALPTVVEEITPAAQSLIDEFWPGPLTILFRPSDELPRKVTKTVAAKKKDKMGVRITHESVAGQLVQAFGGPVLVSSANISRKAGSSSKAQVRKNFGRTIDIMIDAGDVPVAEPSTVVDPDSGRGIVRDGAVPSQRVLDLLGSSEA